MRTPGLNEEDDSRDQERGQSQCLGGPDDAGDEEQTVGAQPLDHGAAETVPADVHEKHLSVVFSRLLPDIPVEQEKPGEGPQALVEEGGVHIHRLLAGAGQSHAAEGIRLHAEGFPVDEVAPAADAVTQKHAGGVGVQQGPEGDLPLPGEEQQEDHRRDDAAVHGDAAVPHADDLI